MEFEKFNGCFSIQGIWYYSHLFEYLYDKEPFKIIGNIYENPELLEGVSDE